MGGGEKRGAGIALDNRIDRKRAQGRLTQSTKLREQLGQAFRAMGFAHVEYRTGDGRMAHENARQLEASVARYTQDRDLTGVSHLRPAAKRRTHQRFNFLLKRFARLAIRR